MDHLKSKIGNNSTRVQRLEEEVTAPKNMVKEQEKMISDVQRLKEDFTTKTKAVVPEMYNSMETQRGQVDSFKHSGRAIKNEVRGIKAKSEGNVKQISSQLAYNALKAQAFQNHHNLEVIGLKEHAVHSVFLVGVKFFKTEAKTAKVDIDVVYRMGPTPSTGQLPHETSISQIY